MKKILIGITGGIAAYKVPDLVHALVKKGHEVQVVMTKAAQNFITPTTLSSLSHHPVLISQWADDGSIPHIKVAKGLDLVIIAPLSANYAAKLAHGFADDLLSLLLTKINFQVPIFLCPSMNSQMYQYPLTKNNLALLQKIGYQIIPPHADQLACGEFGDGAMVTVDEMLNTLKSFL